MMEDKGLTTVNLHFAIENAKDAMSLDRWPQVIAELEKALELAHRLNGDEPEWKPRGKSQPLVRDLDKEEMFSHLPIPPEDPYGEEA